MNPGLPAPGDLEPIPGQLALPGMPPAADQLMALQGTVESADTAPTQPSSEVYSELLNRLNVQLTAWRELASKDLAALNDLIRKSDIAPIAPAPPEGERSR